MPLEAPNKVQISDLEDAHSIDYVDENVGGESENMEKNNEEEDIGPKNLLSRSSVHSVKNERN